MKIFLERKNIMKRVLSLILAGLLTAGTAVAMISCNTNETNNDGEKQPITENDGPQLELPTDVKGGGEDFDIFIAYGVSDRDFIAEEETGDTINDIVYQRNLVVSDYFDINFQFRKGDSNNSTATPIIRSLIQGGDDTYEVFMNVQHYGVPLIYEDLFVEWNENMPYAKTDNPWWYQNVKRDLNFGDKVYVMAGAYNFHCLRGAGALSFNKTMLDEIGLEYPYQLVLDGQWTIDKLIEYSKAAAADLNGDGKIDYENDRLGVAGWKWEMIPAYFVGMGGQPVTKDIFNMPELNINNERTFTVIDKLIELFSDTSTWTGGSVYGVSGKMFSEGRLLFHDTTLDGLSGLRNMEDDFGAVPYPKLDQEQESYYSRIVNFSSLTYIPVTNTKLELTSAVLEYMAYLADRDLIPAYYDIILTVKTTRDVETEAMIDIIRESARFMDENYLTSGRIIQITESGSNTLASNYASYGDSWEEKLEDIIEFWEGTGSSEEA